MKGHHFGLARGGRRHLGREGRGGGYRRGDGMARSERVLDKADLQLLLLSLLNDEARHGYELIRAIKSLSQGCYAPSPGMVYPALNAMADVGLAVSTPGEAGRKSFALSDAGRARLGEQAEALAAVVARLAQLSDSQVQTRAAIARALANLDLVLTAIPPEASAEKIDQIVTLIDGAARQIERISLED